MKETLSREGFHKVTEKRPRVLLNIVQTHYQELDSASFIRQWIATDE